MGTEVSMQSQYTLLELAKRTNQGELITIAEVLNEQNEIMQDAVWLEANQLLGHVGTQRTHLPVGTHRLANSGVAIEAASTTELKVNLRRLGKYKRRQWEFTISDATVASIVGAWERFEIGT